jgi:hypothetical protein
MLPRSLRVKQMQGRSRDERGSQNGQESKSVSPLPVFDLRGASGYLGISIQTLRGLIREGKTSIIRSRPGARILVDIRELEAYIERNTELNAAGEEVK